MNPFTDKQVMDLSNSQSNADFINLLNPQEDHNGDGKKEEIVRSYDFQPIRQPNLDSSNVGETRVWDSADSNTNSTSIGVRNYISTDSAEPPKVILEKDRNVIDSALVSEIDLTMKKHTDNLLNALEGVSARLSQLETRTHHLENSVDDLKVSVGNNRGSTDEKMRQLENILREVQAGVQVIKDNQEIVGAQLQLVKLQVPMVEQQSEAQKTGHVDSLHQAAPAAQQSHQQLPPAAVIQPPFSLPPPNVPPPPTSQQNLLPPVQLQSQFPQNQIPSVPQRESYFPQPGQTQDANQQFQPTPPQQQQLLPPSLPHQQFQPPPHPQYAQPPPPRQQHPSISAVNPSQPQPQPQPQPSLGHHPDETTYISSQNYPQSPSQPSHPPGGAPPSQQLYATPSHMYEPPSSRPGSGFSTAYGPPSGPIEPYPYGGSASQYGSGSLMKPHHLPLPAVAQSGGSSYPQLPTARILPHALPTTTSGVGSGSGSAGTGNKVSIDDVVEKVTNMGFPKDHVRATVRKLIESGQSVDLNVVLDKLMNDGEGQPQMGWFGR
ncbi:uncharacterized protein LOC132284510 [Cornus florida]|uniref:uncharacterized protein LOC132284510 n=1 Tax=Cornus florida TaxID=4283 RepID=UPI00289AEBBA|nr:uncharacterized protein LOC132284510 [Cornus florida]